MTPKEVLQVLRECLREIQLLDQKRTAGRIKKSQSFLANIQLLLLFYPLLVSLLTSFFVWAIWAFIGFANMNLIKSNSLVRAVYAISACFALFLLLAFLLKLTPKSTNGFNQRWWDLWRLFLSKTGLTENEARRQLIDARDEYSRNSIGQALGLTVAILSGYLINCIYNNIDVLEAVLFLSPIDAFHANKYSVYAAIFLMPLSLIYYIKFYLPIAWLQNTISRVELESFPNRAK